MDKNLLVDFGKRLKALREEKGLKQRDMADIMEIKLRQYQRYEYGEVSVPMEIFLRRDDRLSTGTGGKP